MTLGPISPDVLAVAGGSDVNCDVIHFIGDDDYPTGGTEEFLQAVRDALGKGDVEILAIVPQDCGGFLPVYDPSSDKLLVLSVSGGGATVSAPAQGAFSPPPESAVVATAPLGAFTDPPSPAEMAALRALVNELAADQVARAAAFAAWNTSLGALRTLVNELRTDASAAAAFAEVSNHADLSSTTFNLLVISR